ncbi:MAG TPA: hypothetical protein VFW07_22780 [Parafilimonas sp.]|nr:hypothetical protein [Parafilimonas sp.]
MKIFVTLVFLLYSLFSAAQNLNGFWKGSLDMRGGCFVTNNIELQIHLNADSAYGNSYHYEDIDNYVKKKFTGASFPSSKKIILQEMYINTYKIPVICRVCIKKYELYYSKKGNEETLSGNWTGYMHETGAYCGTGPITLTRIRESAFKDVPEIEVDTGQIRLDFYDNAETDGDSISVLVNGRTVITHQKLSTQAITAFIKVDLNNTFQEVEMVAENLGSIPPNTAMLVVTAGDKRYQLFLSSTTEKSARVRFVYNKSNNTNLKE